MLQNPDPESKRILWQPLCTCFLLLDKSARQLSSYKRSKGDQPLTFNWARVQCKTCLSFTMWKKFRLYGFTFPIVIYSITCCTLLNKTHVSARQTWWCLGDECPKKWHRRIKTCVAPLEPSFISSNMQSLLHQGITELCKSLIFQMGTQNPHGINKRCSIN